MRYGATFEQLEQDFALEDIGWRMTRLSLAREYHQDVRRIDWLRLHEPQTISDMAGMLAAEAKNMQVNKELG